MMTLMISKIVIIIIIIIIMIIIKVANISYINNTYYHGRSSECYGILIGK